MPSTHFSALVGSSGIASALPPAPGQQTYAPLIVTASGPNLTITKSDTYSWTAPAGVTSVCVVCVGGAGRPSAGGLGWKNNIPVVPGQSYTVQVGRGVSSSSTLNGQSGSNHTGGTSFFQSEALVSGKLGAQSVGGSYTGDGGGSGASGVGGGAGGYTGAGGAGGSTNGQPGTGGGGGGGGIYNTWRGGGGGVGLQGQGASGAGGIGTSSTAKHGGGGSGGGAGSNQGAGSQGQGGHYGGAPSAHASNDAAGGCGAVRIIWGAGRSYPSNAADV